jgi:7-carboxy-7-deazaguanine synthase
MSPRLRVSEIFYSLQGEARTMGLPTVFVRLSGCPLRCHYCDTPYAFSGGNSLSLADIRQQIAAYNCHYITLTGGEPLAQKPCIELLNGLAAEGLEVSVETSGAIDIGGIDPRVSRVLDIKTPGSGEVEKNRWSNLSLINPNDQIKFVICHRQDYDWAKQQIDQHQLSGRCELILSPAAGHQDATELADWILADRLPVRFQLQLHKLLWGDQRAK